MEIGTSVGEKNVVKLENLWENLEQLRLFYSQNRACAARWDEMLVIIGSFEP
jgi:hypothetical protein